MRETGFETNDGQLHPEQSQSPSKRKTKIEPIKQPHLTAEQAAAARSWVRSRRHACIMTAIIAACVTGFIYLFTAMGVGVWYTIYTHKISWYSWLLGAFAGWIIFFLILLDANTWTGSSGTLRNGLALLAGGLLVAYGLMSVDAYPYGPLCFFMVATPFILAATNWFLSGLPCTPDQATFDAFVITLKRPFYTVGTVVIVLWILWTTRPKNEWAHARKRIGKRFSENGLDCRKYHEENWMDDEDLKALKAYEHCEEVFLLWVSPFVCGMSLLVFGVLCATLKRANTSVKKMVCVLGTLAAGAWCAASLAGAGYGVTTAIFMFLGAGFLALLGSFVFTYGIEGMQKAIYSPRGPGQAALAKFILPYMNMWKGLLTVGGWPFFFIYLAFSALQQAIRTIRGAGSAGRARDPNLPPAGFLETWLGCAVTREARGYLRSMDSWNWTPIFSWATIWGVGLVALTVIISKFTVLAMSIVVGKFENSSVLTATIVLTVVGLFLFLLPPVPGAPIYLASGVLILATAKKNGWTVFPAVAYSCVLSLMIKLIACTLQQKMIGENLAGSLWIRKTCGVNSPIVRMTRLILMEPGLSVAKVTILVGGPDWPTSVLCGILKVDIKQVWIGTSPIMALIIPVVIAGGFLAIDKPYAGVLSVIFASLGATVQSGAIVVAAIYLDKEMARRKDELDAVPYDEEVRASETDDRRKARKLVRKTHWAKVPLPWAALLVLSCVCMTASCYLCTYWGVNCFKEFNIDDKVSKRLDGNTSSIIRPLGYIAIYLFCAALAGTLMFQWCWVGPLLKRPDPDDNLDDSDHEDFVGEKEVPKPNIAGAVAGAVKNYTGIDHQFLEQKLPLFLKSAETKEDEDWSDDVPELDDIYGGTPGKSVVVDVADLARTSTELKSAKKEARNAEDALAKERLRAKRLQAEVVALRCASMGITDPMSATQAHSPPGSPNGTDIGTWDESADHV